MRKKKEREEAADNNYLKTKTSYIRRYSVFCTAKPHLLKFNVEKGEGSVPRVG